MAKTPSDNFLQSKSKGDGGGVFSELEEEVGSGEEDRDRLGWNAGTRRVRLSVEGFRLRRVVGCINRIVVVAVVGNGSRKEEAMGVVMVERRRRRVIGIVIRVTIFVAIYFRSIFVDYVVWMFSCGPIFNY